MNGGGAEAGGPVECIGAGAGEDAIRRAYWRVRGRVAPAVRSWLDYTTLLSITR